jgi:hypothetical protein
VVCSRRVRPINETFCGEAITCGENVDADLAERANAIKKEGGCGNRLRGLSS